MITSKQAGRITKFVKAVHPKIGISPLLNSYWKISEELFQ